jgi:hypothetical protein
VLGNKLEQQILEVFDRDYSQLFSINQISKKLNRSYPHINAKVNNLISEGVISTANVGRSILCSLNLDNEKSIALLILENAGKKERAFAKIRNRKGFLDEIRTIKEEFNVDTIFLAGRDLIFVIDNPHDREAIKNMFSEIKQFSLVFCSKAGFKEYLIKDPAAISSHIVLYSYERYFESVSSVKSEIIARKLFARKKHGQ